MTSAYGAGSSAAWRNVCGREASNGNETVASKETGIEES